ncbi:tail fiber domain-containing protein [Sediminibacter sp. Hel_I_10]|uniref:tail fiber domain-containing protein n=1 Tax=Sediminibacter sp. Hel_I_10 TaxID=1392490 RepID=UPI00047CA455|nr:tail fiber domain-containing protein [Sediminibacter sp. Hel_I_10]
MVTQLQDGTGFGFASDQWFSIGQLNTSPNQMVYGLRFQLPNKALTFGYQDIIDNSPRIQWIGDLFNQGDLEFRFADSFTSTTSNLIASMTNEGQLILPESNTTGLANISGVKLAVESDSFRTGIRVNTIQANTTGEGVGLSATAAFNQSNVSVKGTANGGIGIGGSNIAIQGISNFGFAGFFNGNVTVTGTFSNPSDRKLKTEINNTENALENISQLNGYTYTYKDHEDLNLAKGLQHGLIAQEVELVYPELVETITYPMYNKEGEFEGTGSYKSVNYMGLIAELTEAIKTLNVKVKDLESQLEPRVVYEKSFTEEEFDKIQRNAYQLSQNTPNPFSSSTIISYALPEGIAEASILVLDLNGKLLKTYDVSEQRGQLSISASELNGAGMYLYTLYVNGKDMVTKRMILK